MIARAAIAAQIVLVAGVGCLPRQALSRRDEVEADLYRLELDVDVVTDGLPVDPFRWHLDGTVAWSYTRTFRDGSMGHLVRFPELRARIERGGQTVDVPVPFADAVLELRGFPDGEVLAVAGASRWTGEAGHIELLDVLWTGLSPHLPGSRAEAEEHTSSWPAWVKDGPRVRHRLKARWTPGGDGWTYEGALEGQGGYVEASGTARGTVTLAKGDTRLQGHTFTWTRTTRTTWPTGADVRQTFTYTGRLEHAGAAPAPPLEMPIEGDSAVSDALPLRLRDGRTAEDAPPAVPPAVPFLLLPDDLAPDARSALRARVVGTW